MARSSIGVDIGTRAVAIAEVQNVSGEPSVTRFGRILLPVGAVEHGDIQDPQAVATAITTLWKRLGLSGRAVHVGLANRRVVVRVIELPAMSREDLDGAIRFQAQEHIPIPLAEAVFDYEVLEEVENAKGERVQRVLVVAAERGTIEPLIETLRAAKLEPSTLELNAYPLVRCFGDPSSPAEAIVDIGAGVTDVVVHQGGKIRFTRILPTFGGDEFTAAVAQRMGVPRDEAESLKRRASAVLSDRARQPVGSGVAPVSSFSNPSASAAAIAGETPLPSAPPTRTQLDEAVGIIEPILDRFVTEIRGSLDFYGSLPGAPEVGRVVLTGGGALMGGIREGLGRSLGVEVESGRPFERAGITRAEVTAEEKAVAEPFMGVAIGLGLAGVRR